MIGIGNATALELAFTALAVVGVLVASTNLYQYVLDRLDVRRRHIDGSRKRLANQHLRSEALRVYMLLCFVVIGLMACVAPAPEHQETRQTSIVAGILFVTMELALVYKAIADRLDNQSERKSIEAEDPAWQQPGHDLY